MNDGSIEKRILIVFEGRWIYLVDFILLMNEEVKLFDENEEKR